MGLISTSGIDYAIFGSLGTLWCAGAALMLFTWRRVVRSERSRKRS